MNSKATYPQSSAPRSVLPLSLFSASHLLWDNQFQEDLNEPRLL